MKTPTVEKVLSVYDEYTEIGTKEIKALFECSDSVACKLKRKAKEEMAKEQVKCFMSRNVNIECAYRAWGIDIELYKRKNKSRKGNVS